MTREQRLSLATQIARERKANRLATQIATAELIRQDQLSPEELAVLVHAYPKYVIGKTYEAGKLFNYLDVLYEVVQEHTSQAGWVPHDLPALYTPKMPTGVIPAWVQPLGAHDSYALGDKVIHSDLVWVSIVDANSWEPGVYGWEQEVS